jgi:ankyrin repeat protein
MNPLHVHIYVCLSHDADVKWCHDDDVVAFVSLSSFQRVRRQQLLLKSEATTTAVSTLASKNKKPSLQHNGNNRYQKQLQRLLSGGGRSSTSTSSSRKVSSSTPPWNQEALLQLVQQHPQVCKVMYDFHDITCNDVDEDEEEEVDLDNNNDINNNKDSNQDENRHRTRPSSKNSSSSKNNNNNNWPQYPLWRILQMTPLPSLALVQAVYQAHPAAALQKDKWGNTLLHSLCSNGKAGQHYNDDSKTLLLLIRFFLQQEPSLVQSTSTTSGATPLHMAVRFGRSMEVVQALVEAYPYALSTTTLASDETPLHWACQNTNLSYASAVIPYLLQHIGVNLLATNQRGETSLHILLQFHRQASSSSSSSSSSPTTPSSNSTPARHVRASTRMFLSILQIILDRDSTKTIIQIPDVLGRVPLHLALSFGCYPLEVIQVLVQERPQTLWVRDLSGFTPLHRACLYPAHLEILQYVLRVKVNSTSHGSSSSSHVMTTKKNTLKSMVASPSMSNNHQQPQEVVDVIKMNKTSEADGASYDDDSTNRTASITSPSSTPPSSPSTLSASSSTSPARSTVQITSAVFSSGALQAPIDLQTSDDSSSNDAVENHILASDASSPSKLSSIFRKTEEVEGVHHATPSPPTPLMRLPTRSGALPVHVACEFWTSLAVVRTLVEQDRQALGLVDDQGCTPLHLACASRAPYDMLQYLVEQYPEALLMADAQGRLPLHVTLETIPQRGQSLHPPSSTIVELMLGRELLLLLGQDDDEELNNCYSDDETSTDQPNDTSARRDLIRKATTLQGETAHDIATRHHAPAHILALLAPERHSARVRQTLTQETDQRTTNVKKSQDHAPSVQQIRVPTSKEIVVPVEWQADWMLGDEFEGHDWDDLYQRVEI